MITNHDQANYGEYRPSVMQLCTKALDSVHGPHLVCMDFEIRKILWIDDGHEVVMWTQ